MSKVSDKVGGLAFFLSLLANCFLAVTGPLLLPNSWTTQSGYRLTLFLSAITPGIVAAIFLIRGHTSVLLHEFKHSILSGFVGNKAKEINVEKNSGHFEYRYSKSSAKYNAFIALAPYIIPLFTPVLILISYSLRPDNPAIVLLCAGFGYGIDLTLNVRDISPKQTDFSQIRGGFSFGLLMVVAINIVLFTLLLAWVIGGESGLKNLGLEFWEKALAIYSSKK